MPDSATLLPCCRVELVVRQLGSRGAYVVKDPRSGAYFHLGDEEHFLLTQLDGRQDAAAVRASFAQRFGQPLDDENLQEFLEMARAQGLLGEAGHSGKETRRQADKETRGATGGAALPWPDPESSDAETATLGLRILYWRKSIFDPDRLFTWLAPKLRFCWTPAFVVISAGCIVAAAALFWANRQGLAGSLAKSLHWETAFLVWLVLMLVTTCHEFAHGLTCKHHGGEVHEVGFLMIFFMPCFYCNVSDAWLFREKSRRLWVTLAGGYFEIFLWALAVFVWRLTAPDRLVNHLAFVVMSACGVKTLFNFNPLLKLDGYYLLSDWLEVPNLKQRSNQYIRARVRWLLWGAARPEADPRRHCLVLYGVVSWVYSCCFLGASLAFLSHFLGARLGLLGLVVAALLAFWSLRGLFHSFTAGEFQTMILYRHKRTALWLLALGGLAAVLGRVEMEDRVSGSFRLRPATRGEIRSAVTGFLKEVYGDEGDRVYQGALVARLEVPDLESRLAQKRAEVSEARAKLHMLKIGARPEEVAEQRQRVERAGTWRDLAQQALARTRVAHAEALNQLDKQIAACRAELEVAQDNYRRSEGLSARKVLTEEQLHEAKGKYQVTQAHLAEAQAAKRAHQARGTLETEAEVARRERELADAQATLRLLEAGTRPEEIESEQARLARLQEEVKHLDQQRQKLAVTTPVAGLITTARLKEKVGQYLREGDLICVVEDPAGLEAEIAMTEQDVARVQPGQAVQLKARALPFRTFVSQVDRLAPAAGRGDVQSTVTVYCRLEQGPAELRPEMTGHARVCTGRRLIGEILLDRALRFLRTEFWW